MKWPDPPSVDVLMLAYNVAPFIEDAVQGVMSQHTDFPVRLIIAEDGSTDATPLLCERIAATQGDRILYLPGKENKGIAKRTLEALRHCTAEYVAICDSDDRWTDPDKLAHQVAFLEAHPDHGLSYSDVSVVTRDGKAQADDVYDAVRADYADGYVFTRLLQGNFINNSTTVVRRTLLEALRPDACRDELIGDHLRWLQVAMRGRVHFLPTRTTAYRQGGVTSTDARIRNGRVMMSQLGGLLVEHHQCGTPATRSDKRILARKAIGVISRPGTSARTKLRLLLMLFRYLPAIL